MNPALRTSATGMAAQQTRTEVIANNLANVNTTGFKRSRAQFEDLLYQTMQGPQVLGSSETNTSPAIQVGRGTHLTAIQRLHSQGALEQTGRSLDVAIDGEGFFPVTLPGGALAYTRDGSFQISDQGVLGDVRRLFDRLRHQDSERNHRRHHFGDRRRQRLQGSRRRTDGTRTYRTRRASRTRAA